jgi:hypothetical protein
MFEKVGRRLNEKLRRKVGQNYVLFVAENSTFKTPKPMR